MSAIKIILLWFIFCVGYTKIYCQTSRIQQGLVLKASTAIRLGSVQILDKHNHNRTQTNTSGIFNITAEPGDTLMFTTDNFQSANFVVNDFIDHVIYLNSIIQLDEVVVKEYSLQSDIKEVQRGYREKSVFYTGTPHYYYLVLKPMTFIYENFKSEVKDARRFNRYARKELASYKVTARFNDATIKRVIPIKETELGNFEIEFMPSEKQIDTWNDYQLINYIKCCYENSTQREILSRATKK